MVGHVDVYDGEECEWGEAGEWGDGDVLCVGREEAGESGL